jgi:serine/threonine protein kinase/tetratricopeptide (TPR) repeat protein
MIPEAGQRFGPYEILGRLGSGGMGLVFRAWDDRLHRVVAVKLLHDDYKMPGMRERFLQEARAASALNHPNICTIFDIGEQHGDPYLVMEMLEGETLKDRIARGALPAEDIVRYGQEIADALGAAHAKGIVHRDIKPANIFLVQLPSGKSQAKVLDFGLAKIGLSAGGGWGSRTLDLSMTGATVGTLAYMSPEQGRGESLDPRSDLFSLGIVMYEMATRQVPFKGTTSAQVFVQLFNYAPEPVRNWNDSIPRDLEKVIVKLLAKDRRERFQSAGEAQEALARIAIKRGKGGWLGKNSAPTVPLVRAADPVARQKPPLRTQPVPPLHEPRPEIPDERRAASPTTNTDDSPLRPVARSIERTWDGLKKAVRPSPGHSAVAESDSSTGKFAAARNISEDAETIRREQERALQEARSQSGANRIEYGLDDLDAYGFFAESLDAVAESPLQERLREQKRTRVTVAAAVLVLALGAVVLLARSGHFRSVVLGPRDGLLLTVVENKTGDKTLDGAVMQGMEMELSQSDSLKLLGGEAYLSGMQQFRASNGDASPTVPAQRIAEKVGAKAYLYGEIRGSKAPYTISMDVLNTNTNDKLASLEETAEKREEIPSAISRLAQSVRIELGESSRDHVRKAVPLQQEATGNVEALHAYWLGETAMHGGHRAEALTEYQQAAALDPKFVQAQIKLAWIYRAAGAELTAATAARLAQAAAAHASDKVKLMAQLCYEINVIGDTGKAKGTIRQYVARWPLDAEGLTMLARVSRLRGYLPEALLAAQQSYGENPFRAEAYDEAELAMLGLDRYDDALQMEAQAQRNGVGVGGRVLAATYLGGKTDVLTKQIDTVKGMVGHAVDSDHGQEMNAAIGDYGLYLDNTGQLSAGEAVWRAAATGRAGIPGLASALASLMAQAALDRALVESCPDALRIAGEVRPMERGPIASFHAAMAAALCGNKTYATKAIAELQQNFPDVTAVTQYYVPELAAATDIGVNEPANALQLLIGIGDYDQVSLAPYLRGLAHVEVGQMPAAIFDFQTVLAHRGAAFTTRSSIYPMAEIGVARAAAASHNKADSVAAYQRFLVLWAEADKSDPLVKEALAKSK